MNERFLLPLVLLCTLWMAVIASEAAAFPVDSPASPEEKAQWKPPAPDDSDFDWVCLVSGEWLKGEILLLREDEMEFDSDELDNQLFDWVDVVEVRSPRQNSCLFLNGDVARGTLLIRDDVVIVNTEQGERRFKRDQLMTIIPGTPHESNYWSGKISAGYTGRSGNTDQVDVTGKIFIKRETLDSKITLDYTGNYGKVEGDRNVDNHRFLGIWNYFLTHRTYLIPFGVEVYRDTFQNVDYQVTPMSGVGYHLIDKPSNEWDVEGLLGWRYRRYRSVPPGGDRTDDTFVPIGSTHYQLDITSDVEFLLDYTIFIKPNALDESDHKLSATLSVDITGDLDLDVTASLDRIGDPEPDSNGVRPDKNDYRLTVSLGYEF